MLSCQGSPGHRDKKVVRHPEDNVINVSDDDVPRESHYYQ